MSEIVEAIRRVAAFADTKEASTFTMNEVHFRKGEVFTQTTLGGAVEPIDLELSCGVNAKRLLKALRAVGTDPGFEQDGPLLKVRSGQARAALETSDAKHAPKFHRPSKGAQWVELPLLSQAQRLSWGVSQDPTRTHIGGVALTKKGICATNGHVALKLGGVNYLELLGITRENEVPILPPLVLKDLEASTFGCLEGGRMFLASSDHPKAFRSANLVGGPFPPMEMIFEGGRTHPKMLVDRRQLIDMFKRAKLSAPSAVFEVKGSRLMVNIDGKQQQDALDTLFGFLDSISFEVPGGGKSIAEGLLSLNLGYILPAVETCTSEIIQLGMAPEPKGSVEPVYILDEDFEAVMMPLRL